MPRWTRSAGPFVEARNQAEGMIHQTEKTIAEAGDKSFRAGQG